MESPHKIFEHLSEIHARAAIAYRTDDLAFMIGQDTFHEVIKADIRLRSVVNPAERVDCRTLFGCPVIVTHGSGALCLRREGLVGLLDDITKGINTEIERAARDGKEN